MVYTSIAIAAATVAGGEYHSHFGANEPIPLRTRNPLHLPRQSLRRHRASNRTSRNKPASVALPLLQSSKQLARILLEMDPLKRYLFGIHLQIRCTTCPGAAYWINMSKNAVCTRFNHSSCPLCERLGDYFYPERYYLRWTP